MKSLLEAKHFEQFDILLGEMLPLQLVSKPCKDGVLLGLLLCIFHRGVIFIVRRLYQLSTLQLEEAVLVWVEHRPQEVAQDAHLANDVGDVHFSVQALLPFDEEKSVAVLRVHPQLRSIVDHSQAHVLLQDVVGLVVEIGFVGTIAERALH